MKTNIIKLFGLGLITSMAITSCSDDFLEEKKNYDNVNTGIYDTEAGCQRRVYDVYSWCLPTVNSDPTWQYPSSGSNDTQAKSTEEYSGFGAFVDPQNPLSVMSGTSVPDYFMVHLITFRPMHGDVSVTSTTPLKAYRAVRSHRTRRTNILDSCISSVHGATITS